MHKTIKKVSEDYEAMKFNTAIAALMTLLNRFTEVGKVTKAEFGDFLKLLYPVAPHITEELWEIIGQPGMLHQASWPTFDEEKTIDNVIEMAVQINGKVRGKIQIAIDADQETAHNMALQNENINKFVENKQIVKEIYRPGKIYNIVVK